MTRAKILARTLVAAAGLSSVVLGCASPAGTKVTRARVVNVMPHAAKPVRPAVKKTLPVTPAKLEIAMLGPYTPFDEGASDERGSAWWTASEAANWDALCPAGDGVRLITTPLEAKATLGAEGSGLAVSAPGCPKALVLIRGLTDVDRNARKAAHVQTVNARRAQDKSWLITFQGHSWRLYFEDSAGLPLMLASDGRKQELRNWSDVNLSTPKAGASHDWGFAGSVQLLWVGDVNGDGALDILLKQGDAEIGTSVELYLSVGDANAQSLQLADRFAYGGC